MDEGREDVDWEGILHRAAHQTEMLQTDLRISSRWVVSQCPADLLSQEAEVTGDGERGEIGRLQQLMIKEVTHGQSLSID